MTAKAKPKPRSDRPPLVPEWTASRHEAAVSIALDTIEGAAWLLDQLEVGELGFLHKGVEVPCWLSEVAVPADELKATLESWAITSISRAVQEIRKNLPLRTQLLGGPKAVA
jgi:hypothetical protein